MGQFVPTVVRRVHLTGTHGHHPYDGKLLLGEINDSVLGALEMYGESAAELVNSQNRKRGLGESNCQVRRPCPAAAASLSGPPPPRVLTQCPNGPLAGLGDHHHPKFGGLVAPSPGNARKGGKVPPFRVMSPSNLPPAPARYQDVHSITFPPHSFHCIDTSHSLCPASLRVPL